MRRILIAGLLLVFGGALCVDVAYAGDWDKNQPYSLFNDPEPREAQFKKKPEGWTDDRIADAVAWATSIPADDNVRNRYISKWDMPLRVSLQDSNGNDLDLMQFPGRAIKQYLDDFSAYTRIPIALTTVANHDNNVSIVIGYFRFDIDAETEKKWTKSGVDIKKYKETQALMITQSDPVVGALLGVPELDEETRILGSLRKPHARRAGPIGEAQGWEVDHSDYWDIKFEMPREYRGLYRAGYAIKAGLILIPAISQFPRLQTPNYIRNTLSETLPHLLGMDLSRVYRSEVSRGLRDFKFYGLRLLYNPAITPGMKFDEAKLIILKDIGQSK